MKSFLASFFSNWSRKIAGIAVLVVTVVGGFVAYKMLNLPEPPKLAEWSTFLRELAWTYAIIIGFSGGKSVMSDLVSKLRGKEAPPPTA